MALHYRSLFLNRNKILTVQDRCSQSPDICSPCVYSESGFRLSVISLESGKGEVKANCLLLKNFGSAVLHITQAHVLLET